MVVTSIKRSEREGCACSALLYIRQTTCNCKCGKEPVRKYRVEIFLSFIPSIIKMKAYSTIFILLFLSIAACNNSDDAGPAEKKNAVPGINYATVATFPHDTTSYTEGFLVHDGHLYESTGYDSSFPSTRSLFRIVDLKTGKIDVKSELDKHKYFGEGIVFLHDKVYQLTYKTKIGFVYDAKTFKKLGEFTFPSDEGWGMTTDGVSL